MLNKKSGDPGSAYTIPFITGHKYKFHWGTGLNFENLKIELSERWEETDGNVYLYHNFSDIRVAINVTHNAVQQLNNSIHSNPAMYQTGQHVVYNDTPEGKSMWLEIILNGKGRSLYKRRTLDLKGQRCWGPCQPPVKAVPIDTTLRYWSKAKDWTSGKIPVINDTVEIEPGWNMIYDVAESPLLRMLTINGRLSFANDTDLHINAKHLFIRAGELIVGYKEKPFSKKAQITLHGEHDAKAMVYDNAVEAGNKLIANVGNLTMVGMKRDIMSRLHTEALAGATKFKVATFLDWVPGDRIALADTSFSAYAGEDRIIKTYNKLTGEIEVTEALTNFHWGSAEDTIEKYGVDIRGEVGLLSRNIIISGTDVESWGCQVVTGDVYEPMDEIWRYGSTHLTNVEVYNCSQIDSSKAALRF